MDVVMRLPEDSLRVLALALEVCRASSFMHVRDLHGRRVCLRFLQSNALDEWCYEDYTLMGDTSFAYFKQALHQRHSAMFS